MMTPQMRQKKIKGLKNLRIAIVVLLIAALVIEYYKNGTISYSSTKLSMLLGIGCVSLTILIYQRKMRLLVKSKYRLWALIVSYIATISIFSPLVIKDMQFSFWFFIAVTMFVFMACSYSNNITMEKDSKGKIDENKE